MFRHGYALMWRRFDLMTVRLAVSILQEVSCQDRADGPAARLALRVVAPYVRRGRLIAFAAEMASEPRPWNHCRLYLSGIVEDLEFVGWTAADTDIPVAPDLREWHDPPMCNRYRMTEGQMVALQERYRVTVPFPPDLTIPPPEIFPDRAALVVRQTDAGRVLDTMAWGFPHKVPGKRIDKATGRPVLLDKRVTNVRNYTSPFWKSALANPARRCLVPFTAFSEYGQTRGSDGKLPLHWFDVPSRPIVSFAGVWRPAEGGAVFAFLTTDPNPLVAPIHPKAMPVLLHEEDEERWLSCPFDKAIALAQPYPSQLMTVDA
jgi:putative SOS response-associated peptidase YedK